MSTIEKHIGEALMKELPQKALTFKIRDKAVKEQHIDDKAVTNEKLGDNSVTNSKVADNQLSWSKLNEDLKNIIATSAGQHGIPLSTEFGNSDLLGITQKSLTESRNDLQRQINEIVSGGAVVTLTASPNVIFVNEEYNIALAATTNKTASVIEISSGGSVKATGSGLSLNYTDNGIVLHAATSMTYGAKFVISGVDKTTTRNIVAVNKIYYGSGMVYTDATNSPSPKTSTAGTYQVTVEEDATYVWFNVPSTMTINAATMNGFDFPLESPDTQTIDGVNYKCYRSSNTCDAGTYTIILT